MFEEYRSKLANAERILEEIENIRTEGYASSAQTARHYYLSLNLPKLLREFIAAQGFKSKSAVARAFDMSSQSFDRLLSGGDISENMLFRVEQNIRRYLLPQALSEAQVQELQARPWRLARTDESQRLIGILTESLIRLISAIKESNSIGKADSPISNIQKAQLIATLEAALIELKAPAVDATRTSAIVRWLGRILLRGSENALEGNVTDSMNSTISSGTDLIKNLAQQVGVSDLDKLV